NGFFPFHPLQHNCRFLFRRPFPKFHPHPSKRDYNLYLSKVSTSLRGQYSLEEIFSSVTKNYRRIEEEEAGEAPVEVG
ncbi:MAG: hypothetical protein R6V02_02455, partial [Candidatus Aminicenantes bacterium]